MGKTKKRDLIKTILIRLLLICYISIIYMLVSKEEIKFFYYCLGMLIGFFLILFVQKITYCIIGKEKGK